MRLDFFKKSLCFAFIGLVFSSQANATEPETKEQHETVLTNEEVTSETIKKYITLKYSLYDSNLNSVMIENNYKIYSSDDIVDNEVKKEAKALESESFGTYAIVKVPIVTEISNNSISKTTINIQSNVKTSTLNGNGFLFPLKDYKDDIVCTEITENSTLSKEVQIDNYYMVSENTFGNLIIKWDILSEDQQASSISTDNVSVNITEVKSATKEKIEVQDLIDKYSSLTGQRLDYTSGRLPIEDLNQLIWNENHFESNLTTLDKIYSIFNGEVLDIDYENKFVTVKTNDNIIVYKNIIPTCQLGEITGGSQIGIGYNEKTFEIYNIKSGSIDNNFLIMLDIWKNKDNYEKSDDELEMPLYLQGSEEFKEESYGTSTIGSSGCGPCALSMVISQIKGEIITPVQLIEQMDEVKSGMWYYAPEKGSYHTIFPIMAEFYGLQCKELSISYENIKNELLQNHMVILSIGAGPYYNGSGHFIVLRRISDDGYFFINDSAGIYSLNQPYSYQELGLIKTARSIYKDNESEFTTSETQINIKVTNNTYSEIIPFDQLIKIVPDEETEIIEKTETEVVETELETETITEEIEIESENEIITEVETEIEEVTESVTELIIETETDALVQVEEFETEFVKSEEEIISEETSEIKMDEQIIQTINNKTIDNLLKDREIQEFKQINSDTKNKETKKQTTIKTSDKTVETEIRETWEEYRVDSKENIPEFKLPIKVRRDKIYETTTFFRGG